MNSDIIAFIIIIAIVFLLCYLSKSWMAGAGAIGGIVGGALEAFTGGKSKKDKGPREDKLFVADEWLQQIVSGKKKVEGRAAEKGAFDKWVGKPVKLYNDTNSAVATVDKVVHYDTLSDFLNKEWELAAPLAKTKEAAEKAHRDIEWTTRKGEKFHPYNDERITEKGGIESIHLSVEGAKSKKSKKSEE